MDTKKSVIMQMTGDEFKKLVEQKDPNHLIDTIPEILEFLRGIEDGESLEQYIKRIVRSLFLFIEGEGGYTVRIKLDDNTNQR